MPCKSKVVLMVRTLTERCLAYCRAFGLSAVQLLLVVVMCLPGISRAAGMGEILHQIETSAPRLQAAAARSDAAAAAVREVKSQYWGHAELVGHDTRFDTDRLVNPIAYAEVLDRSLFDRNVYGYGAVFTLPLDIDGRISAKVKAQQHLGQASLAEVEQMRLLLFRQAVSLYRGLQQLEGIKQALNEQLTALRGHAKITATSVRVGRVAAVELLRIKAEIKSVEGQLAGLDGDEARIRAGLAALLDEQSFLFPADVLLDVPAHIVEPKLGDEALFNRPDIHAANSFTKAGDENLKAARREWLPNLSLQAETMRTEGHTAPGQNTWSVTGQLTWQFWDGGRRFAHTDHAHANSDLARQQYRSTLNQARAELQSASSGWKSAALQYQATTAGLEAALETERIQSDRFANGRISAVDLVDAEASLARARGDQVSALAKWWLTDDQLHLARGEAPAAYSNEDNAHDHE